MPFSFRLDPLTAAKIRRLARTLGQSRASVVREAVVRYGVDELAGSKKPGESALDRLGAHVGIISTGGAQLSTNTHAKYAAVLRETHRARRSR
jgi:hypothetical protein